MEVETKGTYALLGRLGRGGLGLHLAVALVLGGVSLPAGRLSRLLLHCDKFSFHSIITNNKNERSLRVQGSLDAVVQRGRAVAQLTLGHPCQLV